MVAAWGRALVVGVVLACCLPSRADPPPRSHGEVQLVSASFSDMEWFALWYPDPLKNDLEARKYLMLPPLLLSFPVWGGFLVPLAMTGTFPDSDWAVPTVVWTLLTGMFFVLSILFCWTVLGWFLFAGLSVLSAWIGSFVTLANLNRYDVKLGR